MSRQAQSAAVFSGRDFLPEYFAAPVMSRQSFAGPVMSRQSFLFDTPAKQGEGCAGLLVVFNSPRDVSLATWVCNSYKRVTYSFYVGILSRILVICC